jgi:hypothetical protein
VRGRDGRFAFNGACGVGGVFSIRFKTSSRVLLEFGLRSFPMATKSKARFGVSADWKTGAMVAITDISSG